jgi:hypothetical protein
LSGAKKSPDRLQIGVPATPIRPFLGDFRRVFTPRAPAGAKIAPPPPDRGAGHPDPPIFRAFFDHGVAGLESA